MLLAWALAPLSVQPREEGGPTGRAPFLGLQGVPNSSGECSVWVYFTKNLERALRMVSHTCNSVLGKQRQEDHEKFRPVCIHSKFQAIHGYIARALLKGEKMNLEENLALLFP